MAVTVAASVADETEQHLVDISTVSILNRHCHEQRRGPQSQRCLRTQLQHLQCRYNNWCTKII